jgi:predicted Zn finger-like uncharacterized protein
MPLRVTARTGLARRSAVGETNASAESPALRRIDQMPRIACPSCGARYDVAAGVLGATGKNVRCARCGNVWLARPEPAESETLLPQWPEPPPPKVRDVADDEPPVPRRRRDAAPVPPPIAAAGEDEPEAAQPRARRGGAGAIIAWVLTLVLLAGAGYGAVRYPQAVIDAWPASARLYAMLGLAP